MKTSDVQERMGVYKRFSDVPAERLFHRFADQYEGQDTWAEFYATIDHAPSQEARWNRGERDWKEFMAECGRHHALATPDEAEAWVARLLDRITPSTAMTHYYGKVEKFYYWLQWHTDHPHTYHPFWMAIVENPDGATAEIWNYLHEVRLPQANANSDEGDDEQ